MNTEKNLTSKRTSSKGNQNKWYDCGYWYKEDALGYESLSEVLVSRLLEKTNTKSFVKYEWIATSRGEETVACCRSADFLEKDDDRLISLQRLFQLRKGGNLASACAAIPEIPDRIRFVVENTEELTGLDGFGIYLKNMLTVDALFLNEDRHFHNIAVIQKKDGTFREAPVFDNGAACFSDRTADYPLALSPEECSAKIRAKPFSTDFDEQLDAAEYLYPEPEFRAWFTMQDVEQVLSEFKGTYDGRILDRVKETLRRQIRKYHYLFKGSS